MTHDYSLIWNSATTSADMYLYGTDFLTGGEIGSSVILSLFTWKRDPTNITQYPGFWVSGNSKYEWGSDLYKYFRAKKLPEVLIQSKNSCQTALQWMVNEKIVKSVDVACSFGSDSVTPALIIFIVITKPDGALSHYEFDLWSPAFQTIPPPIVSLPATYQALIGETLLLGSSVLGAFQSFE